MKILAISDHHRHELANVAALKIQNFEVNYLAIGSAPSLNLNETNDTVEVCSDMGNITIPVNVSPKTSLNQSIIKPQTLLNNLDLDFDLVITTTGSPFFIGSHLANKNNVPLILRTWAFKAVKYRLFYEYKDYLALSSFVPSIINVSLQINSANSTVCLDNDVKQFLSSKMPWTNSKDINVIYPSFITIKDEENIDEKYEKINTITNLNQYVLSIVSLNQENVSIWNYTFHETEKKFFNILIDIARKNPEINVIVIGTSLNDAQKIFSNIPSNMILLGKIYSDGVLGNLYKHATLIVVPILYGAISNRLLESIFYNKTILTNTMTLKLFPELKKEKNVIVSDEYDNYWKIIRDLFKEKSIENLYLNDNKTFKKIFSINKNGALMKKIIDSL